MNTEIMVESQVRGETVQETWLINGRVRNRARAKRLDELTQDWGFEDKGIRLYQMRPVAIGGSDEI